MSFSSQEFETYVPVYDAIPEKWEDGRDFLVEHLKKISNAVNVRTVGFYLDQELLSGNAFIPGETAPGNNPGIFRSIFRKTFLFGPVPIGISTFPHEIELDENFTLIHQYASGTNYTTLTGGNIWDVSYDVDNFIINTTIAYEEVVGVLEYIFER